MMATQLLVAILMLTLIGIKASSHAGGTGAIFVLLCSVAIGIYSMPETRR